MKNMKMVFAVVAVISFTSGVVLACAGNNTSRVGRDAVTAFSEKAPVKSVQNAQSSTGTATK